MGYLENPLIAEAGAAWEQATSARFLDAIREGSLPDEALDRWLVQDRTFASDLFRFQSILLAKAPEDARAPLLNGLVALDIELSWFRGLHTERGLIAAPPHPVCERYTDFLMRAAYSEPFPRLVQILFGVEVTYLHAWTGLKEAGDLPGGIHEELIVRWSNDLFRDYVDKLEKLARRHRCPDDRGFRRILDLERDFWRMTWEG